MPRVDKYQLFRNFLESPEFGEVSARDALEAFEAHLTDKTKERRKIACQTARESQTLLGPRQNSIGAPTEKARIWALLRQTL